MKEGATGGQPHLAVQDAANVDPSKLTALSPQVVRVICVVVVVVAVVIAVIAVCLLLLCLLLLQCVVLDSEMKTENSVCGVHE